jgi:hypothetical protein
VGAGLELRVDFGAAPTIDAATFALTRDVITLPSLGEPAIEDDVDSRIRREAFAEILIQLGIAAGDNVQRSCHSLLI